jgi:hypothetical protein
VTGQDDVQAGNLHEERFDKRMAVNNKWSAVEADENERRRFARCSALTVDQIIIDQARRRTFGRDNKRGTNAAHRLF